MKILNSESVGQLPCFCVSTDTGRYTTNGIISHNSVAVQNIILHALSHWNEVSIGLIDIKQVEFSNYKNMKGIVGVANTIKEAVSLLRIARLVMYARNKEMAKLGIKQLSEHRPTKKSGMVFVTGREFKEEDLVKVRIDGKEQEMRASELVEYLHN